MTRSEGASVPPVAWEHERDVALVQELLGAPAGHIHLMGVGGIGMAGLAKLLHARGLRVSGCDVAENAMTGTLRREGIEVTIGHSPEHISDDVTWAIRSTAVRADDPEVAEARRRDIPVFMRGAVLAGLLDGRLSVAISGTHGKTTTTAMAAQALMACGMAPGFCVGGDIPELGVASNGDGSLLIVEADESDATVELYCPDVAVVTNIEYDHMEHFGSEGAVRKCFERFVSNASRRVVYCRDDAVATDVCGGIPGSISYGLSSDAVVRGEITESDASSVRFSVRCAGSEVAAVRLPVAGLQNVQDALAVLAVGLELGCDGEAVAKGLAGFKPVARRFQTVCDSAGIRVISDYCHHPTEIRWVVAMAKQLECDRLVAVFQPHRYTRTRALGADFPPAFDGIDDLILAPVYAASEDPLAGGTTDDLHAHFTEQGRSRVRKCDSLRGAWQEARSILKEGDVLLVLGAGDVEQIGQWASEEFE